MVLANAYSRLAEVFDRNGLVFPGLKPAAFSGRRIRDLEPRGAGDFVLRHGAKDCVNRELGNLIVAVEGFELVLEFQGKTYVLQSAGDSRGIIAPNQAEKA